jgi:hypothetical protein
VPPKKTSLMPKFEGGTPLIQLAPVFQLLLSALPPFQVCPKTFAGNATKEKSSPETRLRPHAKRGMTKTLQVRDSAMALTVRGPNPLSWAGLSDGH